MSNEHKRLVLILILFTTSTYAEELTRSKQFAQKLFFTFSEVAKQNPPKSKGAASVEFHNQMARNLIIKNLLEKVPDKKDTSLDGKILGELYTFLDITINATETGFAKTYNHYDELHNDSRIDWLSLQDCKKFVQRVTNLYSELEVFDAELQKQIENFAIKTWHKMDRSPCLVSGKFANGYIQNGLWRASNDAAIKMKPSNIMLIKILEITFTELGQLQIKENRKWLTAEWQFKFLIICYTTNRLLNKMLEK